MKTIRRYGAALGLLLAALLLAGCGGTTPAKDVAKEPPTVDHRAPLMGFWEAVIGIGEETNLHSSITLTKSRFVALLDVYTAGDGRHYRVSGSWSATDTGITLDWADRATYSRRTATLSYSLEGIDLTVGGLAALMERSGLPDGLTVILGRQTPWTVADFVGQWTGGWLSGNGASRYLNLTYNVDGTCSWEDLYRRPPGDDRPDNRDYFTGTCEIDLDENFLHMDIATAQVPYQREPLEGHTVRFAFARWEKGADIIVSPYREDQAYDPLTESWVDSIRLPYGYYWLHLGRE